MSKNNDKRTRLIDAADKLFYEQGYYLTSLDDIACMAAVPLGNVYYYFKKKEDICSAIIHKRFDEFSAFCLEVLELPPVNALKRFASVHMTHKNGDYMSKLGHELCSAVGQYSALAKECQRYMLVQVRWVESVFEALSDSIPAYTLAVNLVAMIQGANLIGFILDDDEICLTQANLVERWIENIV